MAFKVIIGLEGGERRLQQLVKKFLPPGGKKRNKKESKRGN